MIWYTPQQDPMRLFQDKVGNYYTNLGYSFLVYMLIIKDNDL